MAERKGSAVWEGTLKQGKGTMKLGSGAYEGPYSFSSRFENASGTNPEELIGAAEAGCFSMALSSNLEKAGHPARLRYQAQPARATSRKPCRKSDRVNDAPQPEVSARYGVWAGILGWFLLDVFLPRDDVDLQLRLAGGVDHLNERA